MRGLFAGGEPPAHGSHRTHPSGAPRCRQGRFTPHRGQPPPPPPPPLSARAGDGAAGSSRRTRAPLPASPAPAAPARLPPCPRAAPFPRAASPPRPPFRGARGAPAAPDPSGGSCRAERCEAAGAAAVRSGGRSPAAGRGAAPRRPQGSAAAAAAAPPPATWGTALPAEGRGRRSRPRVFSPLPGLAGPREAAESSACRKFGGSSESNSAAVTAVRVVWVFSVFFRVFCVLFFFFSSLHTTPRTRKQPATTTTTKKSGKGQRTRERGAPWVGRAGFLCRDTVPFTADPNATAHPPPPLRCRLCELLQPSGHHCPCPERIYKSLAVLEYQARW